MEQNKPSTPDFKVELDKQSQAGLLLPFEILQEHENIELKKPVSIYRPSQQTQVLFEGKWRSAFIECELPSGKHVRFLDDGVSWFIPRDLMGSLTKMSSDAPDFEAALVKPAWIGSQFTQENPPKENSVNYKDLQSEILQPDTSLSPSHQQAHGSIGPKYSEPIAPSTITSTSMLKRKHEENFDGGLPLAAIQAAASAISMNAQLINQRMSEQNVLERNSINISPRSPSQVTTFVGKLYDIFSNSAFQPDLAFWNQEGTTIAFKSKILLEKNILPLYFKHCNARSLARQLNSYGFTKVFSPTSSVCFSHPYFLRGRGDLLHKIVRKETRTKLNNRINETDEEASNESSEPASSSQSMVEVQSRLPPSSPRQQFFRSTDETASERFQSEGSALTAPSTKQPSYAAARTYVTPTMYGTVKHGATPSVSEACHNEYSPASHFNQQEQIIHPSSGTTISECSEENHMISSLLSEIQRLRSANRLMEVEIERQRQMLDMSHQNQSKLQMALDQAWLDRDNAQLHSSLMAGINANDLRSSQDSPFLFATHNNQGSDYPIANSFNVSNAADYPRKKL